MDLFRLLPVEARDFFQDLREARPSVLRFGREIGAAPERLAVGGQKHGEGPAALFAQGMQGAHINRIYVGPFFTIYFDVDVKTVHNFCDGRVFEAFMCHDMAPVTGGVADGEQNGLVFRLGTGERVWAPWVPMDRIVLVLQKVGAGLVGKQICGAGLGH